MAKVRCALAGDFCSVLGNSLFLAVPRVVVFGMVSSSVVLKQQSAAEVMTFDVRRSLVDGGRFLT